MREIGEQVVRGGEYCVRGRSARAGRAAPHRRVRPVPRPAGRSAGSAGRAGRPAEDLGQCAHGQQQAALQGGAAMLMRWREGVSLQALSASAASAQSSTSTSAPSSASRSTAEISWDGVTVWAPTVCNQAPGQMGSCPPPGRADQGQRPAHPPPSWPGVEKAQRLRRVRRIQWSPRPAGTAAFDQAHRALGASSTRLLFHG